MSKDIEKAIETLGRTVEEFKSENDKRLKEIETKGHADPILEEKVNKMADKIGELEKSKSDLEAALARKTRVTETESADLEKKAAEFSKMTGKKVNAEEMKGYQDAFVKHMRKGDIAGLDVQKALSVGSDPDGGYLVTPDMSGRIIKKVFETSPIRQFAAVQTIGTDALEGTFDLEEASSGWVGETGSRTETNTPKLAKWKIPTHELYANPAATQKLLDDANVNMEQWLAGKVSEKFARDEANAFVVGDGIGKPRGFTTYGDGTTIPGTIEQFASGVSGGFATDGTGGDVFHDIVYGMKAAYRAGARWSMNRTTLAEVRKIKDGDGNYIWQPGLQAGTPSTLAGYMVAEFEDMANPGADSLSIAFANFAEGYQIVDRQGIRVLRDPYTNKPYVHFYTVKRVGGDVVNFEAIKLIRLGT